MDDKKGALKDYVEVNVRIMKFYEKYPEGRLHTEIVSWDNGTVVMKATAYRDNTDIIAATGHAYEKENSSFINKTSALENCYHESTDILTDNGWRNIKEFIDSGDIKTRVAQVNLKTNEMSFDYPIRYIKQENQEFLRLEDNLTCQIITPEHYVVIDNKKIFAKDVKTERYKKTQTNKFNNKMEYNNIGLINISLDFIRILQWIIADGYIDFKHNHIKFGFKKKRKFDRLIELLNSENIDYTTSFNEDNKIFRVNIKQAQNIIAYIPNKTLTYGLTMSLGLEQRKAFIEEIALTDGCEATRGGIYLRQTDKSYFENLCLMAAMSGYDVCAPTIDFEIKKGRYENAKPIYRLRLKENTRRNKTEIKELVERGTAYCLEMPEGTLVTRNNNKITISSNCETSAIGRALGILGFEIKKGIASKEEVENAKINQQLGDEKTNELIGQVIMLGASKGLTMPMVLLGVRKDYKKDIKELTDKQFDELFEKISKLPDKEIQNAD